jgi:hypothetical protein
MTITAMPSIQPVPTGIHGMVSRDGLVIKHKNEMEIGGKNTALTLLYVFCLVKLQSNVGKKLLCENRGGNIKKKRILYLITEL